MASVMRFDEWQDSEGNPVASAAVGTGKILQVVYAEKTDTQTFTSLASGAASAITGLTASITPSSTSSKILVSYDVNGGSSLNSSGFALILKRDSTAISIGDADGSKGRVTSGGADRAQNEGPSNAAATVLDSPATSSSITYSLEVFNEGTGANTLYVNRSAVTADASYNARTASRITLMEVAG